jgi:hypothetical protein
MYKYTLKLTQAFVAPNASRGLRRGFSSKIEVDDIHKPVKDRDPPTAVAKPVSLANRSKF